jgi:hypothetical protein
MSVNKYLEHLIILPEDYANRQIANGFSLVCPTRQMIVESEIGGWMKVVDYFLNDYIGTMRRYPKRYVVLVIDFDGNTERLCEVLGSIPADVSDRVFVFGCRQEPEDIKKAGFGSFENIGRSLANACISDTEENIWDHSLLANNHAELERFKASACQIILD